MRLTKAQRDLLEKCAADPRGMTGAASHSPPAKALVSKGMAAWRDGNSWTERLIITEAGRLALQQAEEGK